MFTRTMNGFDKPVSVLGFGCMRFPTTDDGKIDRARARAMLLHAHKMGVNYYDTAYPYHGGESEIVVGEVLKEIPRDEYFLTTKLPVWEVKTREDAEALFEKQLGKLRQEYLDLYLLHAMNEDRFQEMEEAGVIDFMFDLKKQGKIKNVGFSFHDDYPVFEKWIKKYPWDACQIQFNFMDIENQAGTKGLKLAESLGIPVIVMEPIRGGALANVSSGLKGKLAARFPQLSPAGVALTFASGYPAVMCTLSGMSNMQQLMENVYTFSHFKAFSAQDNDYLMEMARLYNSNPHIPCTACRYCMPCPHGVDIPGVFGVYNALSDELKLPDPANKKAKDYKENRKEFLKRYATLAEGADASFCTKCNACLPKCPQRIRIPDQMRNVHQLVKSIK